MEAAVRVACGVGSALVLTATLMLAGCSDETSPGGPRDRDRELIGSGPVSSGDAPQQPSSGQGEAPSEAPGAGSGEGSEVAAAPSFPAVTRDDLLDALWEIASLDGERPDVDLIREVGDEEWMSVHVECMTEVGFPPTSVNDQAVRWDGTAGQADAFELAKFTCEAQYPRRLAYSQPYTTEQLTMMYDWMIEETVPCLAAEGYEVTDVVSLETFMASYSPQGGFWTPDAGVPGGASFSAQEACPHMPPQELLFGQ